MEPQSRCGGQPDSKSVASERDTGRAMSRENVEIVRGAYEAFERGDYDAARGMLSPDIEWEYTYGPEAGVAKGLAAVEASIRAWLATWDSYDLKVEGYLEAEDAVVACCRQRGRGAGSGLTVEDDLFQVWTIGEGKLTRMVQYQTRREALDAVGLSE